MTPVTVSTLASHTMPDFLSPVLTGMVVVAGSVMLLVSAVGVRLFVRPFARRQLMGMLTAILTGMALSVAATFIAIVFAIEVGERGFYLSAAVGLCMCWFVGYRVARYYAPPAPETINSAQAGSISSRQDNPYVAPGVAGKPVRVRSRLRDVFHLPVEPTWYHRVFRKEPGDLPAWVCNSSVGGVCLISIAPILILAAGIGLATIMLFFAEPVAWILVAASMWAAVKLGTQGGRTRHLERRCRARIRRGECLRCGDKLETGEPGIRFCSECQMA
ncbi:MAG: hypothetical protein NXI04_13665 [Planctomycetaceae bacterium]|nr:hypothetical protein [Planctomycetaceae bacterium]